MEYTKFEEEIKKIITLTGDSTLLNYNFSNNVLNIELELEDERILKIKTNTFLIYGEKINEEKYKNTGILQYKRLEDCLKLENGYYTISGKFEDIIKISREKINLALGLKKETVSHLIYYKGYNIKLAFLVNYDYIFEYKIIEE